MIIDIQCSCCGHHEKVSNSVDAVSKKIFKGWGSCGSALYCPECSKEWPKRNGDRPMADERNTFIVITTLFIEASKATGDADKDGA